MGLYLNQLPQTEVARLKAELAETLIANFCYPRFYDYRINALRTRPVDRAKRQEVWQYLNAVDFNVWGRVDVDSPDFQRQVERLFIHFVQRNRSFFGEQGRKRMTDVRSLITSCSNSLADGLRGHLRGQQEKPPFGSPRSVSSWSAASITGNADIPWEQMLTETMQLQQQMQEARGEVRPAATQMPSTPSVPPSAASARPSSVPSRRPRQARPTPPNGHGSGSHEDEAAWSPTSTGGRSGKPGEVRMPAAFQVTAKEAEFARTEYNTSFPNSTDAAPTMPLPLGKSEGLSVTFQPTPAPAEISPSPARSRRGKPVETSPAAPSPSGPLPRTLSQPLPSPSVVPSRHSLQPAASAAPMTDAAAKQPEGSAGMMGDEDVVIFEQMRHQLVIWLRVEAVRSGVDLNGQGIFQLVDVLCHQDSVDAARLQVVSTLLTMCDQVIKGGRASLFDYKQAMMFYLMHTRRGH